MNHINSTNNPCRFGSNSDPRNETVNHIQTRFWPIDHALGGGLCPRESTLIIGTSGGGKTLCCCQLASNMALNGTRVLLISTDQSADRLKPRFVSCQCDIPFGRIHDGIIRSELTPEELALYHRFLERMKKEVFQIFHWVEHSEKIEERFEEILNSAAGSMGNIPEVVILDGLSDAFGRQHSHDVWKYRAALMRGARLMAELATKYNIHTITTAQANESQCIGRVRVDASVLSENKSLGEPMTNILGISALKIDSAERADGNEGSMFRREQFLYLSKSKSGAERRIPVIRDFAFQRFLPATL